MKNVNLTYQIIDSTQLKNFQKSLDPALWTCYDELNDTFLLFTLNNKEIGLVCCSFTTFCRPLIEMIEVFFPYRRQHLGNKIIDILKTEWEEWYCVPKDESAAAFFTKMGFLPSTDNSQIWYWHK